MALFTQHDGYLFSATKAQITSSAQDTRACKDYGFLWYQVSGQSAIFNLEASHDLTAWHIILQRTATATETGSAQIQGYYPFIRGQIAKAYTGTGGALSATATVWMHYTPGVG